jgi:hypothetical protein
MLKKNQNATVLPMPQSAPVTPLEPICGAYLCSIPFCFRVQNDILRLKPLASSPPLQLMPPLHKSYPLNRYKHTHQNTARSSVGSY